jgi:hypothetical protein
VDSRPADRNAALSTAIRVYHRFPGRDCGCDREDGTGGGRLQGRASDYAAKRPVSCLPTAVTGVLPQEPVPTIHSP